MKKFLNFSLLLLIFIWQINNGLMGQNIRNEDSLKNVIPAADAGDRNNNFYDNAETYSLPGDEIEVMGEIENPGKVDFSKLSKHSVIVKETLLKEDGTDSFIGAYRYDGYSLFDILNDRIIMKKNADEFKPIIDLYVEIENQKGEKVILSWGEIYYPNTLHNCIIATDVARIVPSRTKDLWPLPTEGKLVIGNDLITERNISNPVKITVKSYPRSIPVNRDLDPLYSPEFKILKGETLVETFKESPKLQLETVHTIFYGRGRGIHSTQLFTGFYLKEILVKYFDISKKNLQQGLVTIAGKDGYRSVFTYSEIMNQNDQAEVLLVTCKEEKDGGQFRIFPSCDFFSDRAVKAVSEIYINR
ncbi:MAG: hypothetical protein ABSE72_04475 [Bacteroidales bacterium]